MTTLASRGPARLLAALLVALPLAACASPSGGSSATADSASPSGSPFASSAVSPTAGSASPPASSSAPPSGSPTAMPTGFACPVASASFVPPSNRLERVTVDAKPGFDEVVFSFAPSGVGSGVAPSLTVESAAPPFVRGASGLPLTVAGESFVRLIFREMIVADESGNATMTGPTDILAAGAAVREAVETEAFEGVVSWIVGSAGPGCARVIVDPSGRRVLLDVRAP